MRIIIWFCELIPYIFRLKKTVLLHIAQQIPEEEIESLKAIFKKIDTNGNGIVTKEEMVEGF